MTSNTPPMSSEGQDKEQQRLADSLAFWQQMMAQLEVDARNLNRMTYLTPLLFVVGLAVARSWAIALVLVALVAAVWSMGRYMVMVRRTEYNYHISDIQRQLHNLTASAR